MLRRAAVALLGAFASIERRAHQPLIAPSVWAVAFGAGGATGAGLVTGYGHGTVAGAAIAAALALVAVIAVPQLRPTGTQRVALH
ncbi:MAG: hypothetical protein ACRDPM_23550 [Solirubrobacteraceae bacterium]